MATTCAAHLAEAMRTRRLIRFRRRFEDARPRGYVLDAGPRFFLLALVSDRLWFDGFECFRVKDVSQIGPDPYAAFAEAALKKRGERRPRKPRVSMAGIEELLRSAGRAFTLVTIHREQVDPHVCHIGAVVEVGGGWVWLLEISPDASWEAEPTRYQLGEITRVNFGGDYEEALHLVGGEPDLG